MPKTAAEREDLLERVETAMLRGAHRIVDIIKAVPDVGTRATATEYMDIIQNRWSSRQSDNEAQRQRLIDEKRELIRIANAMMSESDAALSDAEEYKTAPERAAARTDAYANKAKAMKIILDAQSGIAKLLGLEVKKIEHSGSITEERNSTIAILTASAESHTIRGVLCGLADPQQAGPVALPPEPAPVALSASEGSNSASRGAAAVPSVEASPMGRDHRGAGADPLPDGVPIG